MSIVRPDPLTPSWLLRRARGAGTPGKAPVAVKAALMPLPSSYARHGWHKPSPIPGAPACGTLAICSAGVPTVSRLSNARVPEPPAYHLNCPRTPAAVHAAELPRQRCAAPWRTEASPVRLPRVLSWTVAHTARQKDSDKRPVEEVPREMNAGRERSHTAISAKRIAIANVNVPAPAHGQRASSCPRQRSAAALPTISGHAAKFPALALPSDVSV